MIILRKLNFECDAVEWLLLLLAIAVNVIVVVKQKSVENQNTKHHSNFRNEKLCVKIE